MSGPFFISRLLCVTKASMAAEWEVSGRLTLIHKDQSELVLGAAVPHLSRVRALVILSELVEQDLHQTFGLVKVDLAVLYKSKQALPHILHSECRWQAGTVYIHHG